MSEIILNAVSRTELGKGASRRLRKLGNVPAIVYGGKKELAPAAVTLKSNELKKAAESEAFFSSVLSLSIDGKAESVVLMDVQRHPATDAFIHVDFERVDASTVIHKVVPLHFLNETTCVGVKVGGGKIQHNLTEVEVTCKATNLPEFIEVDMAKVEAGHVVHLSELVLPQGVELVALQHDSDQPVCSVVKKAGGDDSEATEESAE
ncbi:50S ribosomal protein L25/general stress protein Ctc [Gynuella sunshinyii]|uniref:Large ribosomal subunit protein bL25 n=1 Tax=Gynuella sunshinyii YC6258 TaxID=1445510 RepID=A0A0C5VP25_9GAMM|nr:50S ribosomal protein L25/general stress protein Ctc [Gynuella sunshinyii]AJQ96412.1 ribosomal protein L25 (general stress protein Ctc) [Gynuella sunshinyii YC6258]